MAPIDYGRKRINIGDFSKGDRVDHKPFGVPYKGTGTVGDRVNAGQVQVYWDEVSRGVTKQGVRTLRLIKRAEPALRFKAGDRINYNNLVGAGRKGAVVQDVLLADINALIKLDTATFSQWEAVSLLTKIEEPTNESSDKQLWHTGADSTSEKFRRDPSMRKWETRYTKSVIDDITTFAKARGCIAFDKNHNPEIFAALNLLKGYWSDLHIPYEQRDAALAEAKRLDEVCTKFRRELSDQDQLIEVLRAKLLALSADAKHASELKP